MKKVFQVCVIAFFSVILAITALTDPFESLADEELEYYDFQPITNLSELKENDVVYFSSGSGPLPTGVVTSLPDNTGILKVTSGIRDPQTYTGNNRPNADHIEVTVIQRDANFDSCPGGYLWLKNGVLAYNCNVSYIRGLEGNAIYKCKTQPRGTGLPPEPVVVEPAPAAAPQPVVVAAPAPAPEEPWVPGPVHEHNYFWQEGKHATEDDNGELEYVCPDCGEVIFRVPTSAYAVFNSNAQQKILTAPANSTVTIDTQRWISFHKDVLIALAYRPDVSLEVNFLSEGHKGDQMSFTIPAGTDIVSLLNNEDYCGFLYLNGCMNAGTLPADTAIAETATAAPVETTDNAANADTQTVTETEPKPQPKPEVQQADNALAGGQITIPSGVDSYYVANLLEQAGIVDSAATYDRYLVQNGYDRRIQIGTKTIPEGSDNQQIAQIITSR
ncbi:MAG: hypothetical protein J5509_09145 [Lachnospiraceae bacterium]|nr:hypothetical protein [Lachnospiraceae bacterium]